MSSPSTVSTECISLSYQHKVKKSVSQTVNQGLSVVKVMIQPGTSREPPTGQKHRETAGIKHFAADKRQQSDMAPDCMSLVAKARV